MSDKPWRDRPWQVRLSRASGFSLGFRFHPPFLLKLLLGVHEVWIGYQHIPLREQRRMRAASAAASIAQGVRELAEGRGVYLGSFETYADEPEKK